MSAPVEVLLVLRPAEGGMRRHVLALLEGLDRSRFRPVVAGPPAGDWEALLRVLDVPFHPLAIPASFNLPADLGAAGRLLALLARLRPRLVHCHGAKAAFAARLAAGNGRVPVVYTVHGAGAPSSRWQGALATAAERALSRRTARYIAVSGALADMVVRSWGVPRERVSVVYNGVAVSRFEGLPEPSAARSALGLDPARPVVGMIGRLVREKGPDVFVRAAPLIAARIPACRFVLAGDGPALKEIKSLAASLRIAAAFAFPGYVRDAAAWLAAFDVYVQPSRSEGLGTGILEAMAAGRPVVASRVGGVPEIVSDGRNGLLVPPGDPQALADAVTALLSDAGLRCRLATAGRGLVRAEFDEARAVRETENVYETLIHRLMPQPPGAGFPRRH